MTLETAPPGEEAGLAAVEMEVDQAAAELWGITDRELKEIRLSLEELNQVRAGLTTPLTKFGKHVTEEPARVESTTRQLTSLLHMS